MSKRLLPLLMISVVLLTACGSNATPTMNPADVQGTAVAAAWTMVAMTQQSIPTATPLPPTATLQPTPLPTFTLAALPTLSIPPTSTPAVVAGATDTCMHPLDMAEAGPTKRIRIENESGGTLNLSLTLYTPNAFGQCGALSWGGVERNAKINVELPAGYWYAYAWINLKNNKQSTAEGSFYLGPSGSQDLLRLVIREDVIGLIGP